VDVYDALPPAAALLTQEAEARQRWWDPRVVQAFQELMTGGDASDPTSSRWPDNGRG
jgi:hypothetical protein